MENKILFQINYDTKKDKYKFILNEMDNQEFLAFTMFLKCCINEFESTLNEEIFLRQEED